MNIKFYIVTYNREHDLNKTLESLFATDISSHNVEICIVNNHSNFRMNPIYNDKVKVLHNVMRPDFSTGHLSRNYNEIFIHGFKNLAAPACDILMHSHDDNTFHPEFFSKMLEHHKTYEMITFSQGCGLMSYLPEAVRKNGMWDERFCTIGYHEGDYFLRALRYNRDKTSINDWAAAHRQWNPIPEELCFKLAGTSLNEAHAASHKYYSLCRRFWIMKWGNWRDQAWSTSQLENVKKPELPQYMMYPYFEKDIYDLEEKYYPRIEIIGHPYLQLGEYANF